MDSTRFDALTRTFAELGSRRRFLAGVLGGAIGLVGSGPTEAGVCRGTGSTCREDANCCSGLCARDAFGRRSCQCPASTEACGRSCVDPTTAYQSDPSNCGSCSNRCPTAQCQQPTCTAGVCGLAPNPAATGTACDDGDRCTENDVCTAEGTCLGTPVDCSQLDGQCTQGVCNPQTGGCEAQSINEGQGCNDGSECTTGETCQADGTCGGGTPVDCSQLDGQCTQGVCNPQTGGCEAQSINEGQPCDTDNDPSTCETCQSGVCTVISCCVPKDGPCNLNNPGVCCSKACLSLSGGLEGKCL